MLNQGSAPARGGERARRSQAVALDADILHAIRRGWQSPLHEDEFDSLASRLFQHQWEHNAVARRWWEAAGATPRRVRGWRDVPPLPVTAHRTERVAAFPEGAAPRAGLRFLSSGTTSTLRSRVYAEGLELYEAALLLTFRRSCLPDGDRMRLLFLAPSPAQASESSLSHMFGVLLRACGSEGSGFCWGSDGLPGDELCGVLESARSAGEALFLLGPAFAFVQALDVLRARGAGVRLPRGSRLFQTGGFKGRSRSVEPASLLGEYERWLGIPPARVFNEYGMAELASQFYAAADASYVAPPWVRWRVLDPLTLEPVVVVGGGGEGALAVWDLANRSSCFALRTEDLAAAGHDRFRLLGRLADAEPRGCSLTAEEGTSLHDSRTGLPAALPS
nr:hypothetical protein [Gemmatimonadota bacterium]